MSKKLTYLESAAIQADMIEVQNRLLEIADRIKGCQSIPVRARRMNILRKLMYAWEELDKAHLIMDVELNWIPKPRTRPFWWEDEYDDRQPTDGIEE
jgi:hypothetical protein